MRTRLLGVLVVGLAAALLWAGAPAQGATVDLYVCNTAAGLGNGSDWADAYGTIQAAVNATANSSNDFNIYIEKTGGSNIANYDAVHGPTASSGWYDDSPSLTFYGGYTVSGGVGVKNAGDVSKILSTAGVAFNVNSTYGSGGTGNNIRFLKLVFEDMNLEGLGALNVQASKYNVTVNADRSIFKSTSSDPAVPVIQVGNEGSFEGGYMTLTQTLITGGVGGGIQALARSGGSSGTAPAGRDPFTWSMNITMTNTAIVNVGPFGISARGDYYTGFHGVGKLNLGHVTISGATDALIFGTTYSAADSQTLATNDVLYYPNDTTSGVVLRNDSVSNVVATGDANAFYGYNLQTQATSTGGFNLTALTNSLTNPTGNPLLAADGYHLLAGSAMIDAAVGSTQTVDIDGVVRPQGTYSDIGAVEAAVPEPATLGFLAIGGALTLAGAKLRRHRGR